MLATINGIVKWISRIEGAIHSDGRFTAPEFFEPFHLLVLALLAKKHGGTGLALPDRVTGYAARMGLWEAAGMPPPFKGKEHDSGGRFMPVQALIDSARVSFSANHLVRIASQKTSTDDTKQSLWIVFTELLNNCYDHAQKNLGLYGLACAQSWPKANWAQVAIIDSGEGIRETLMGNPGLHSRLREDNACSIATEYGTTGKPLGHSGYGLNLARRLMELNGGNIIVISDHEAFSSSKGQVVVESIGTRWRGTIVVLEWPIRAKLDVGAVYAEWPPIDG